MIGHSWVARLKGFDLLPSNFSFVGFGGATFPTLARKVELLTPDPAVGVVFVFAGSNDIDRVGSTAEVNKVFDTCREFDGVVKVAFPNSRVIYAQIEDRYNRNHRESASALREAFKRKSNKFNKWLNKTLARNSIFLLKGANSFSNPQLYARDGVHLNLEGNMKLARKIVSFV